MKKWLITLACALLLLNTLSLFAEPTARPVTQPDDSTVRELESRYARFASATHKGDLATFRSLRTAEANQSIPANARGEDLKAMAEMVAPSLTGFKFVQLETKGKEARMTYKRHAREGLSFLVLMFEKDAGGWKIGANHAQDFVGKTPGEAEGLKQALTSPEVRFSAK